MFGLTHRLSRQKWRKRQRSKNSVQLDFGAADFQRDSLMEARPYNVMGVSQLSVLLSQWQSWGVNAGMTESSSIQPVRETVEEEENRLLNRTMAPAWCLLFILFSLLIVCLLFICLCAIKLSQHVLQVALGKQRGANCKLWSLDEVTAERVAAVSRAVSGASMLRSADILCR